jgi:NTF2 fold immunity protein
MTIRAFVLKTGLLALGGFVVMAANASAPHSFVPKEGFISTEATAIRIAEAVWEPIYGKEAISHQQPLKAQLANGVWTVVGTLPEGVKGGVALIEIRKQDGCILRVSHGK